MAEVINFWINLTQNYRKMTPQTQFFFLIFSSKTLNFSRFLSSKITQNDLNF